MCRSRQMQDNSWKLDVYGPNITDILAERKRKRMLSPWHMFLMSIKMSFYKLFHPKSKKK